MKKTSKTKPAGRVAALLLAIIMALGILLPAASYASAAAYSDTPSAWAAPEIERAMGRDLIPENVYGRWQEPITRQDFAYLAVRYLARSYGYASDREFINDYFDLVPNRDDIFMRDAVPGTQPWWDYLTRRPGNFVDVSGAENCAYIGAAYYMNVISGRSSTTFDPYAPITRQEAASLLARSYRHLDHNDIIAAAPTQYQDFSQMAHWAVDDIAEVMELGIMGSTSANSYIFKPLGTYTREQAVATFLRLWEKAPVCFDAGNVVRLDMVAYDNAMHYALNDMGQWESDVLFQDENPYCTVLAIQYFTGTMYESDLLVIYTDGREVHLEDEPTIAWELFDNDDYLRYTTESGFEREVNLMNAHP